MSSFIFQREQINCTCLDSSLTTARRIFRAQSFDSVNNNPSDIKEVHFRNQSQQRKNKKKSLKKQKPISCRASQKDIKQKDQIGKVVQIPQIQVKLGTNKNRRQQKVFQIGQFQPLRFQNPRAQRNIPTHNFRTVRTPGLISHQPMYPQFNNQIPKVIQSEHTIPYNQYEKLVTKQFERDFLEFKLNMQAKQRQKQKQIQRHQAKKRMRSRKQSISASNINSEKIQPYQSYHKTSHQIGSNRISFQQVDKPPNRACSFRNSTGSHIQKESISKRMRGEMFPKQIQSERDGSDSDSSKMSEVIGRGWDGLTQQRIQLEQLQEMTKKQRNNTQTNATQQSHIKNSQMKTFTEYSSSFISPKSQNTKGLGFGGGHKYGITGMSYQHIDDLGRNKIKTYTKINF